MGNVDSVPVISQTKSLIQVIGGDEDGARKTQENFLDNCPVVSQGKSFVQLCAGDEEGARETQIKFLKDVEKFGGVASGVVTATAGVVLTPIAGPVGTSLIGAGANGVISVYTTSNDEKMDWEKFGKETAKGAVSGAVPVAGDVAAQALDNHFEGRPLDKDLGKAAAIGAVTWGVGSGLGSAGKSVANATKKKVVDAAGRKVMDSAGKQVLKDTVTSKVVKAAVPLVKGSVEGAAVQVTGNVCDGKDWDAGLGKAIATGAVSSGVGAGMGKAGRKLGGSQKGIPRSERTPKSKTQRAVLGTAALARGGAKSAAGQVTANICDGKDIFDKVGDEFAVGAMKSGTRAGFGKMKKMRKNQVKASQQESENQNSNNEEPRDSKSNDEEPMDPESIDEEPRD